MRLAGVSGAGATFDRLSELTHARYPLLAYQDFPGRYARASTAARARTAGCHSQFDELQHLSDRLLDKDDELDPHAARVAIIKI